MDAVKTECESLKDLKAILDKAGELGVDLLVIGGWAVNAHVGAYRFTKDIDLVMRAVNRGHLKGLLKQYGYQVEDKKIYIKGQKDTEGVHLEMHISVGDIVDISRDPPLRYAVNEQAYRVAPSLPIRSYHLPCREYELRAPILPLDNLFITKLLPVRRELDVIDVTSIILEAEARLDLEFISQEIRRNNLVEAILSRIEGVSLDVESGRLDNIWAEHVGRRVSKKGHKEILRFMKRLDNRLRQSP